MALHGIPDGVIGRSLQYFESGGDQNAWLDYTKVKQYTNAFIVQEGKILLGYKKRGFGQGKYNGFGGKVEPGETPLEAAKRELLEESGVTAPLVEAGNLFFVTKDTEWAFQIHIFFSDTYQGTPQESDEMRPEWFSLCAQETGSASADLPLIPFEKMWATDHVWIPLLPKRQKFAGRADFLAATDLEPYKWWYAISPSSID